MPQATTPKPVQLEPPGPYETPVAVTFLGLLVSRGELPPRVCLALLGGIELRIPLDQDAQEKLRRALNDLAEDNPQPNDD